MIRWTSTAVVVLLAAVAAVVSYRHAYEVITLYGESGFTAYLVPATVDGLIYGSSMVMLDSARRGLPVPALARWSLGLGIAATLAANVAHGLAHGPVGAIVAAWPAAALVLSYELLMGLIRRSAVPEANPQHVADLVEVDTVSNDVTLNITANDLVPVGEMGTDPSLLADAPAVYPAVPPPSQLAMRAARHFAEEITAGQVPPLREIKSALGCGQPKASQVQAYLRELVAG